VPERDLAFWACLRSHFLLGMAAQLPEGTVQFGKQLVGYIDGEGSDKVVLRFADGSTAESDVGSFRVALVVRCMVLFLTCYASDRLRRNPLGHAQASPGRRPSGLKPRLHPQDGLPCSRSISRRNRRSRPRQGP
jgi:hypothetical protein